MTGQNELKFNKATIMRALQFWLASEVIKTPFAVTDFVPDPNSYSTPMFVVTIMSDNENAPTEAKPKEAKP